jgi:hypothetical protein
MPHALTEEQVALLRQALPPTSVTVTSACVCRVLVCGCVGLSWLRLVPLPALVGQECLSLPLLVPAFARVVQMCVCVCVCRRVCVPARARRWVGVGATRFACFFVRARLFLHVDSV